MSEDEWKGVAFFMENAWRGEFDKDRQDAYKFFLLKFDAAEVMAALVALSETGGPFLPAMPEVVQKVRAAQEPPVPGWGEVWDWLCRAMRAQREETALHFLEERSPLVARFMQMEGWERLRQTPFFDPDYGGIRVKEIQIRWEEFVGVAKERLVRGRALEAAGLQKRLGPRSLDQAALLETVKPEVAGELEAGEEPSE